MNKKIILFFTLAMFLPAIIYGETYWGGELPNISDTKLKAEVTLTGDIYTYNYTIISGPINTGQIWSFDIDIKQPRGGVELSGEGLVNGPGYLKQTSAQVLSEPSTPKMVPVGLFSPPNWNSGPNIFGWVGWGSDDVQYRILPSQRLNGFQITSRGLPGLRDSKIEPKLVPPSEESDITIEQIQEVEDKVAFKGKTIGPTAPPKAFWPTNFLETIRNYIDDSVALGWLIDPALVSTLQTELDTARSYIEANDPSAAKEALARFMTALDEASSAQRTTEAYGLLFYNAQYLKNKLPDTYIPPPPPVLDLKPEEATLPIGAIHTLTATLTQDNNPLPNYSVYVEVISGPNEGLILNGEFTDINGQAVFSYTSTKVGTDKLVARAEIMPAQVPKSGSILVAMNKAQRGIVPTFGTDFNSSLLIAQASEPVALSLPVQVTWTGGPDLVIKLFIPPLIVSEGGKPIFITEITGNMGSTDARPSITRYFLSEDKSIDPNQDRPVGERSIPALTPGEESDGGTQEFILPDDIPAGRYHLGACADAEQSVVELDEQNNCEINKLAIVVPMELPSNQSPNCTLATPSKDILWPPNHKLVTISISGITDPDNDPVTITITHITQDEPVNGLGDGDTSPDGFGVGMSEAQIRAERSGRGNGRVYAISFTAEDGKGGSCTNTVQVGVPHDLGKGVIPIDDGQNYDSTIP